MGKESRQPGETGNQSSVRNIIRAALASYRCSRVCVDEDGNGLPLVDALTEAGETIRAAEEELDRLAEHIDDEFPETFPSQGGCTDTALLDWLESCWPVTNIDVFGKSDAELGLTFDDGRREGNLRADNLRDLLFALRARLANNAPVQVRSPALHPSRCFNDTPGAVLCQVCGGDLNLETVQGHASDCAVHNAPALPVGPCDCGYEQTQMRLSR